MELIQYLLDILLNLDSHLLELSQQYGTWLYLILFLVVFAETGLVVTPFLPGDSLLFAVGSLCAIGALDLGVSMLLLFVAAVVGDAVNYHIGQWMGPSVFQREKSRFFRKEYLDKTHAFYEKYGGKTIVIARFVPIVRTFAPFVAGIGAMTYAKFLTYNVVGALLWVISLTLAGYYFGNLPFVRENFSLVIFAIILISILPGVVEYFRHRSQRQSDAPSS